MDRTGERELSPEHELFNDQLFAGAENSLMMKRSFSINFECQFRMYYYPFDDQVCHMILVFRVRKGN